VSTDEAVGIGLGQSPPGATLDVAGTVKSDAIQIGTTTIAVAQFERLVEFLDHVEFVDLDDGFGNPLRTMRVSGVNLQIVSGAGATNGNAAFPASITQTSTNGLGNLIVGYNEPRPAGNDRTGSHMIVTGSLNNYGQFGGIVSGRDHFSSAPYAAILGGESNTASDAFCLVAGGNANTASGPHAVVLGGGGNVASGQFSTIAGGRVNTADGTHSSVSGGRGGLASGTYSVVSGGLFRTAPDLNDWVAGELFEDQ
jgi:hypothetical protein